MSREVRVKTGFAARVWQARVFRAMLRFTVLVVHRRGGKTVLAVMKLIDGALRCKTERGRFAYVAPYAKQAREIAWGYVKQYTRAIPGMHYNEQTLTCTMPNGAMVQLFGADNPDSLRGLYFDGVVLDEVADMRPQVWGEIIRPALMDRKGWALFIGTPKGINLFSDLYFHAVEDKAWHAECLTWRDTDALDPEELEQARATMSENEWNQEMECSFEASVENALITLSEIMAAEEQLYGESQYSYLPKIGGIDYAWEGGDRSVFAVTQGFAGLGHHVYKDLNPNEFVEAVLPRIDEHRCDALLIDVGYAPGVYSQLKTLGYPAHPVHFGSKAHDSRFENRRAEIWFELRDWLREGGRIPRDPALRRDLASPQYFKNRHMKIQLESKDQIKSRLGLSPDLGDAYALTRAAPAGLKLGIIPNAGQQTQRTRTDFDAMAV